MIPTAMTNLTHPHRDVPEECFCLTEFSIVWALEEFSTIYFSGLHMHGGELPQYQSIWTDNSIYTCITVILYPPQVTLNGESTLAFTALPYPPDPCRVCQKRDKKEYQSQSDKGKGKEKDRTERGRDPLKATLLKLPMEWCRRGYVFLGIITLIYNCSIPFLVCINSQLEGIIQNKPRISAMVAVS